MDSVWIRGADIHNVTVRPVALVLLGTFAALWMYYLLIGASGAIGADIDNYWKAATRLRTGEELYVNAGDPNAWYAYAPWFAWLWVPLTYLPFELVAAAWFALLAIAAGVTLWRAPFLMALVLAPFVAWAVALGNVAPLIFAGLSLALPSRWGPVAIGIAASLKAFPLLLALVYVGRREWRKAALAGFVTLVLVMPMLFYDLSGYSTDASSTRSVWTVLGPVVGIAVAVLGAVAVLLRPSWRMASIALVVAMPRLLMYDVGYLLVTPSQAQPGSNHPNLRSPDTGSAASSRAAP